MTAWSRFVIALCIAMFGVAPTVLDAQTVQFRGRVVMVPGGPPFRQMTVRLDRYGVATPNDGGFFVAAIPSSVMSLTIQVETGNPRWTLRYPLSAIAVPRDANHITDIIVGPSIEETLSRDYAASIARLRTGLRNAGAADSQVIAAIEALRREFAERTNVRMEELRSAERSTNERARILPPLSASLETYVIKATNLEIAFRYLLEPSFGSDSAFAQLNRAIVDYNLAYESLRIKRNEFENDVAQAWQNAQIASDLRALFDYALGDINTIDVLPLNEVLPTVSEILTGKLRGAEAQTKRIAVLTRVQMTVTALRARLEELERRKIRVLTALRDL